MNKQHKVTVATTFAVAALLNTVQAVPEDVFIQTSDFGSREFHEIPHLGEVTTAGLITGYIIFGVILIFSVILVVRDMIVRHKDYLTKLEGARKRMLELGISVEQADKEFELVMRGIKPEDEDDKLINAAEN